MVRSGRPQVPEGFLCSASRVPPGGSAPSSLGLGRSWDEALSLLRKRGLTGAACRELGHRGPHCASQPSLSLLRISVFPPGHARTEVFTCSTAESPLAPSLTVETLRGVGHAQGHVLIHPPLMFFSSLPPSQPSYGTTGCIGDARMASVGIVGR